MLSDSQALDLAPAEHSLKGLQRIFAEGQNEPPVTAVHVHVYQKDAVNHAASFNAKFLRESQSAANILASDDESTSFSFYEARGPQHTARYSDAESSFQVGAACADYTLCDATLDLYDTTAADESGVLFDSVLFDPEGYITLEPELPSTHHPSLPAHAVPTQPLKQQSESAPGVIQPARTAEKPPSSVPATEAEVGVLRVAPRPRRRRATADEAANRETAVTSESPRRATTGQIDKQASAVSKKVFVVLPRVMRSTVAQAGCLGRPKNAGNQPAPKPKKGKQKAAVSSNDSSVLRPLKPGAEQTADGIATEKKIKHKGGGGGSQTDVLYHSKKQGIDATESNVTPASTPSKPGKTSPPSPCMDRTDRRPPPSPQGTKSGILPSFMKLRSKGAGDITGAVTTNWNTNEICGRNAMFDAAATPRSSVDARAFLVQAHGFMPQQ